MMSVALDKGFRVSLQDLGVNVFGHILEVELMDRMVIM